ncbi:hypothetical protein BH11PSE2_BH11PSE2_17830 [soil metagenome]
MKTVLITGARAPIALDLFRSFTAAGWSAHLADSIRPWTARLAGLGPGRLHQFSPPRFAFEAFTADLGRLVSVLDVDLIVPTCEEVFYLAAAAERLGLVDRLFAPSPATLRRLHSKVEFAGLAQSFGIAAPQTWRVTSPEELQPHLAQSADLVFKPEFSRFATKTLVRPTAEAAARLTPTAAAPWAVQAFVDGEELCLWSAIRNGEVVAFAAYRPLWRLGRSSSFYFETDRDPALLDFVRKIAGGIGGSGQLSFDVIRGSDGAITPIECNPRGVSGLHLIGGGPGLAQAITGEGPPVFADADARHLSPAMWLLGAPKAVATGRWREFRRDLARSRDVLGSPMIGLGALLDAGRFCAVGLSRGRSASGQSTDDIEWNGEPIG